jgi:hypothetical protein
MKYAILKQDIFNGKKMKDYSPIELKSEEIENLTNFLLDSYDGEFTRDWLSDEECHGISGNQIEIDKKGESLVLVDLYDQREKKFEFVISRALFLKALDQWEAAIYALKEYIIIELADDNKDISIYAVDSIDN